MVAKSRGNVAMATTLEYATCGAGRPRRARATTDVDFLVEAARLEEALAIERRRREVVLTGHGRIVVGLSRHCPWLVDVLVERFAPADTPAHRVPGPV